MADQAGWHALSPAAALAAIDGRPEGLTGREAAARLAQFGPNALPHAPRTPLALIFLRQFRSPLIYLLLAAATVSLAIGHMTDAGFILVVLCINALIGTVQEGRASASAEALRRLVRQTARVRRDGRVEEIDAAGLVPGDLVLIETGARVPADLRLLHAMALQANESLLTGEALPVAKSADALCPAEAVVADRVTMLHAGSVIVTGRGEGVVVATGEATELGKIDAALRAAPAPRPPLMLYLERLSRQVALVTLGLVLVLGTALAASGAGIGDIFLLVVALAVSAIPEGLPVAVTVALSAATSRMAARNVIVRTLPAVEGLGACTLIATDKTGTLTLNRLSVEAVLLADGEELNAGDWAMPVGRDRLAELAVAAALCNEAARSSTGEPVGDSVDVALLRFADAIDGRRPEAERLALFAYEPENRFASVAVRAGDEVIVYAKGAIETVAAMCGAPDPAFLARAERLAAAGYRVLALARGLCPNLADVDLARPGGLDMIGAVGLLDPLRPEAPEAIRRCREAGIEVRLITGDHPATAITIARALGLASGAESMMTGSEIAGLAADPAERARRIEAALVFARTDPSQKLLIVETLQRAGHLVAVTGDGVNDAPALQAAQIGVAMGRSGTDVAREAADLILTDDNFASIVAGVEEGRVTFGNLRKIVVFLLATGIAEIGMFLGAVVLGLPMPLTAVQLLWSNLVTNGAQDVMLGFGRAEGDELRHPPRRHGAPLIDGDALRLMVPPALTMTLFALLLFGWMLGRGESLEASRNAVLLATVLFQNAFVLSVRSMRPIWREPLLANPWLVLGVAGALLLHIAAMAIPSMGAVLGTSLPDPATLAACLGAPLLILIVAEATKAWLRRSVRGIADSGGIDAARQWDS